MLNSNNTKSVMRLIPGYVVLCRRPIEDNRDGAQALSAHSKALRAQAAHLHHTHGAIQKVNRLRAKASHAELKAGALRHAAQCQSVTR